MPSAPTTAEQVARGAARVGGDIFVGPLAAAALESRELRSAIIWRVAVPIGAGVGLGVLIGVVLGAALSGGR